MTKGKVLLAYSGGLDTSCILAWLIDEGYEVMAYMANIGQEEDFKAAEAKALKIGATKVFIEGVYLLGTAIARPIICRKQIEIAKREGCQFVSHGCTGKGNDQVRFELGYYSLHPSIQVITPWRDPVFFKKFPGRPALLAYAALKGIPVVQTAAKPWSTDENIYHISYEAGILENPNNTPPKDMWKLTVDPEDAPNEPERITIHFKNGIPVKVENTNGKVVENGDLALFNYLNEVARKHGVGRLDIVENRFIGIKSRGCYETPAGTLLRAAHVDLEGLTLDREVRRLKDQYTQKLAEIIYNGFWFSAEREFLMASVTHSQTVVNGSVKLKLYKGHCYVEGRSSPNSLYDEKMSSMDETEGFHPSESEGFIKTQAIRLKAYVSQQAKMKK
ncbi:argininosuccinate synthetase [Globomyces sp. JEL0801]|nr:argininosuccinate synthetase [Globomyces sp. JEL0801]